MSVREKFSDDQWLLLTSLPSMIGGAMSNAAKSGMIGTLKEKVANVKAIISASKEYPENELVQALIQRVDDFSTAKEKATELRDQLMSRMESLGIDSLEKFEGQTLADCEAVTKMLEGQVSAEVSGEYRNWVMSVAEKVAEAASEGGFLGFGGERVSESERVLLAKIQTALNIA